MAEFRWRAPNINKYQNSLFWLRNRFWYRLNLHSWMGRYFASKICNKIELNQIKSNECHFLSDLMKHGCIFYVKLRFYSTEAILCLCLCNTFRRCCELFFKNLKKKTNLSFQCDGITLKWSFHQLSVAINVLPMNFKVIAIKWKTGIDYSLEFILWHNKTRYEFPTVLKSFQLWSHEFQLLLQSCWFSI